MARSLSKPSGNTLSLVSRGYGMPAEWEPHAATWLAWPHYHGDWPGKFEPIPWVYAEIIRNLSRRERVELIVNNAAEARQARKILERADALSENVRFHHWPTNRVWLRDSGCIFLKRGAGTPAREGFRAPLLHAGSPHSGHEFTRAMEQQKREGHELTGALEQHKREGHEFTGALEQHKREGHELTRAVERQKRGRALAPKGPLTLKFLFNAWAKYSNWRFDEKIGSLMAKAAHCQEVRPLSLGNRIVLEGGSIDVNGAGTILTTEECLLSKEQERNPHMSRVHYEKAFADYLGAPHTIWLGRGIFGDDTHGHVDDLTRFVAKDTVVTMVEPNSKDVNHAPLRANLRRLQAARDQNGRQLNIVEIPMPQPVVFEGRRLPASYANFYIANGVVLAPVFNRANDRIALNTLAQLFPSREIVPIYSGDFIWGLGAMHCMTQQQPA
ncbi:MAG: agmatine deiminase family protein [Candidatus Sulfotelmatobacter sp.]